MVERDPWELRLQRLAVALLVLWSFRAQARFSSAPFPVGIAVWIDVSFLGDRAAEAWATAVLAVCLAAYVAGIAAPLALAGMAFLYTAGGALAYSQGALQHHTQLLALVLIAQLIAHTQAWLWRGSTPGRPSGAALAAHYSVEVIAASYLLAGLMKIVLSRGEWLAQVPMIATEIAKAHGQAACTTGDAALIARGDAIAAAILAHPTLSRVFFGTGLLMELASPLALVGRRAAFAIGAGLLLMHVGIDALMQIRFRETGALLLIYLVNVPHLLARAARMLARRGVRASARR
ncbi:MAG: hypothetical protein AB7V27_13440 [Candidatus Binatia bacterium]